MKRMLRSLIRFIAVGLMALGIAEICLGYLHYRVNKPGLSSILTGVIVMLLGICLMAMSARISERLTRDFEE
jgi:hypothetical protein